MNNIIIICIFIISILIIVPLVYNTEEHFKTNGKKIGGIIGIIMSIIAAGVFLYFGKNNKS